MTYTEFHSPEYRETVRQACIEAKKVLDEVSYGCSIALRDINLPSKYQSPYYTVVHKGA